MCVCVAWHQQKQGEIQSTIYQEKSISSKTSKIKSFCMHRTFNTNVLALKRNILWRLDSKATLFFQSSAGILISVLLGGFIGQGDCSTPYSIVNTEQRIKTIAFPLADYVISTELFY